MEFVRLSQVEVKPSQTSSIRLFGLGLRFRATGGRGYLQNISNVQISQNPIVTFPFCTTFSESDFKLHENEISNRKISKIYNETVTEKVNYFIIFELERNKYIIKELNKLKNKEN